MINTNLFTVFPIYDDILMQNQYKLIEKDQYLNDVSLFKLYCPKERLLPFQFRRAPSVALLTTINLYTYNGILIGDILPDIPAFQIEYSYASGWDYITYYGSDDLTDDLPCGDYYLEITDGTTFWYSEVFHVSEDVIMPDDYRIYRGKTDYREWDTNELRTWR